MTDGIRINGEEKPLSADNLGALMLSLGFPPDRRGVAVAVNGEVVPRAGWDARALHAGDEVEIIEATQGG